MMTEKTPDGRKSPFDVPYRLETRDDLNEAIRANFLDLGKRYRDIDLFMNTGMRIHKPTALRRARTESVKDFFRVDEIKAREYDIDYHEIENLGMIDDFELIERRLPGVAEIVGHENLFGYLADAPTPLRDACRSRSSLSLPDAYDVVLRLRKFLRSEILSYLRTKRTRKVTGDQLRKLITASALFTPAGEYVLQGIRTEILRSERGPLYQNAVAEILFVRIPRFMEGLISPDPPILREKLLVKTHRLGLSPRQRLALSAYIPREAPGEELVARLDRVADVSRRLSIDERARTRLLHFIDSQKQLILSVNNIYQELFLDPTLVEMRKLYEPGKIMTSAVTSWNTVMKKFTFVTSLAFYPRKDWLEFAKDMVSSDCSHSELGRRQLSTPHFFNIRVFSRDRWIGNVYCLDFTEEHGCIIIDRIQIPRDIRAHYIRFFDGFREVLGEIFADVDYEQILVPLTISNHRTIQKVFNSFRRSLPTANVRLRTSCTKSFESLRHPRKFHTLCRKERWETENPLTFPERAGSPSSPSA